MLSAAVLILNVGMSSGQSPSIKINPKKFQKYQEFSVEIDSARSLASVWAHYDENFFLIDSTLNDRNFPKDSKIKGRKTVVVYRLKKFADCQEVIAFAETNGLSFVDAQALPSLCGSIAPKIPNNRAIIAVNRPENLCPIEGRDYIFFKYKSFFVPYIAYSYNGARFGVGHFVFGCARGDYLVFYKDKYESQAISKN